MNSRSRPAVNLFLLVSFCWAVLLTGRYLFVETDQVDSIPKVPVATNPPILRRGVSAVANVASIDPTIEEVKHKAFAEKANQTLKALPSLENLRRLDPEDSHATPSVLLGAAIAVGRITDEVASDPELRFLALDFYTACAVQQQGVPAIRAVCLERARELHHELLQSKLDVRVPDEVERLAW